jgi:hypothetical protein
MFHMDTCIKIFYHTAIYDVTTTKIKLSYISELGVSQFQSQ